MLLRCTVLSSGIDCFFRSPLSRLPSTLTTKRTASTQKPKGAPQPNAKTSQPNSGNKNSTGSTRPPGVATPLEKFFSQFKSFRYQPSVSPFDQFDRLCKLYSWGEDDPKRGNVRNGFDRAMKKEFGNMYESEKDIKNWPKNSAPNKLPACCAVVFTKHVNLVDLLEYLRAKGGEKDIRIFSTEKEHDEFTRAMEEYFLKGGAAESTRKV